LGPSPGTGVKSELIAIHASLKDEKLGIEDFSPAVSAANAKPANANETHAAAIAKGAEN
jgi:hypothetical protein